MGYRSGQFPVSERAASEALALPIYPELPEGSLATVVDVIAGFYSDREIDQRRI
jgi:UDP-2-acetamido-2-deoxy-ribo-hexuluronate aminotransferase